MSPLRIREPSLVVLIGAAGSGKSTLAARWFAPEEILSSDALRAFVSGDAADQRATKQAFAILQRTLDRRLMAGRTTVVDATNVTARARRELLAIARRAGVPAIAIVLDLPPAVVHARNAAPIRACRRCRRGRPSHRGAAHDDRERGAHERGVRSDRHPALARGGRRTGHRTGCAKRRGRRLLGHAPQRERPAASSTRRRSAGSRSSPGRCRRRDRG